MELTLIEKLRRVQERHDRSTFWAEEDNETINEIVEHLEKGGPVSRLTRDQVRTVFLGAGFTVKEGQTDLKEYVYKAAEALVAKAAGEETTGLSFERALFALKAGHRCARAGWNGKNLHVQRIVNGKTELYGQSIEPFFVIRSMSSVNTWVPSVSDLNATDWAIV